MTSLVVFRYLMILSVGGLGYAFARRLGLGRTPLTHLVEIRLRLRAASSPGGAVALRRAGLPGRRHLRLRFELARPHPPSSRAVRW